MIYLKKFRVWINMSYKKYVTMDRKEARFLAGLALEGLDRIDDGDFAVIYGFSKSEGMAKYDKIIGELFPEDLKE